jgi:hypothetical protein
MTQNEERSEFSHYKRSTLDAFKKFHSDNPHVYKRFKELAISMYGTGRKRYSSKLIINVMRWESDLNTNAKPFKINDRFQSLYGRLLAHHDKRFKNWFEFRVRDHSENDKTEEDYI